MPQLARASFTLHASGPAASETELPKFHTVPPPGRYTSKIDMPDGSAKKAVVVIDEEAYGKLMAKFAAEAETPGWSGLLVDREHLSELPAGDSTAAAWVKTLHREADGLWSGWELTDLGQTLIPTKRFKFRSPVFDLEPIQGKAGEWRPVRLVSVALTNVPHFKTLAASAHSETAAEMPEEGSEGGAMDALIARIRARFKKPEAEEAELIALLDAMLAAGETAATECASLKARNQELELAETNRKADAFVAEHGAKVADAAKLRARFIEDPAGTVATLSLLKPVEAAKPARMLGRDGETPERDAQPDKAAQRKALIATIKARDNCSNVQATTRAQRENPELWK
jgi:hypothetical protein